MMKRFFCILAAMAAFAGSMRADEGMWLLPLLQKMNATALKEMGCELTPKQIYNINGSSLKDAIVQFGGGCTGEVISKEGLLITNHHCGYSNIQKLSSVEHDYLKNGYWAMNRSEELPCEGLTVTFLEYMKDITPIMDKAEKAVRKQYKDSTDVNLDKMIGKAVDEAVENVVKETEEKNPHCEVAVESFYNHNRYYIIVYKTYKDIRFVGAPPSSIGKFGADTDNWMWPRHTGDFSMFRIYADKDNNPAEYSADNVPYRSKDYLSISLKGIQEGDYTMIMGYPGRTTRFQTSPELKYQIEQNDIRIAARTIRQNVLMEDMLADPKVKIQYANKYASSSNGWKKWQGMKLAFDKLEIIDRAEREEAEFTKWVKSDRKGLRDEKYGEALANLADGINDLKEPGKAYTTISESVYKIELTSMVHRFKREFRKAFKASKDTAAALEAAYSFIAPEYKDYSAPTDRKVAKAMMKFYRDNAKQENHLSDLPDNLVDLDIDSYIDEIFDNTAFTSEESLRNAIEEKGAAVLEDPAGVLSASIINKAYDLFVVMKTKEAPLVQARHDYMKGLLEWKGDAPIYPDANFTMRLTYGKVKGYSPKDAVIYRYYTTLDGVMEKEDPDNWEFVVPDKLKELWKNKDFGQYAMANGKMPLAFLSNNDITGGNSGSPIMNSKGELIGLAFDGNWESMSSDVMFEPDLQRCINVDIRYVLFIVDKFGGAGYLLDEMNIVK